MKYLVTVTQQDIDEGECGSYTRSPVALACRRAIGERFGAAYHDGPALHTGDAEWPSQEIPTWMARYDAGEPVSPFTFEVEIVDADEIAKKRPTDAELDAFEDAIGAVPEASEGGEEDE